MEAYVAALAAALLLTPPAHAAASSQHAGECSWDAVAPETDSGVFVGVFYTKVVVYAAEPADSPVSATVTCTLRVNGAPAGTWAFTGTTVVAGAAIGRYRAPEGSVVQYCTTVDYLTDDTPTETSCASPQHIQIPPGEWPQVSELLFDLLAEHVDPVACAAFADLAPGVPGVFDVDPSGDVTSPQAGLVWDCPPYEPYEW